MADIIQPASPEVSRLYPLTQEHLAELEPSRLGPLAVQRFWSDETQTDLEDAAKAAIESLEPQVALELVPEVEELIDRLDNPINIWESPKNYRVNEHGMVSADLGNISQLANVFDSDEFRQRFWEEIILGSFGSLVVIDTPQIHYSMGESIQDEEGRRGRTNW